MRYVSISSPEFAFLLVSTLAISNLCTVVVTVVVNGYFFVTVDNHCCDTVVSNF